MPSGNARAATTATATTLTPAERARLVGVLGRLGSDHDGERAAAGLLASRLLNTKGLTWGDLIVVVEVPQAGAQRPGAHQDVATDLALCRRHSGSLNPWLATFIASIAQQSRPLSVGQRSKLRQTAAELQARGLA